MPTAAFQIASTFFFASRKDVRFILIVTAVGIIVLIVMSRDSSICSVEWRRTVPSPTVTMEGDEADKLVEAMFESDSTNNQLESWSVEDVSYLGV